MEKTENAYTPFPVVDLDGTSFYVNGYDMNLVQVDDADNCIDMLDMLCFNDHVELWYDGDSRNVYYGPHYGEIPDRVTIFWMYPLDALDPLGKNRWMDENRPDWRRDFPTDLPVIQIAGKEFFADEKRNAFRDTQNCWNLIHFTDVLKRDDKTGIYIDTRVVQVPFPYEFDIYEPPAVFPEHIIFAEVPDGYQLATILNEHNLQRQVSESKNEQRRIGR